MNVQKIAFIIEDEKDTKIYNFLQNLKERKNIEIITYTTKETIKFNSARYISSDIIETVENVIEKEIPDLIVVHKENVDPFKKIFSTPEYIKLSDKFKTQKFLFLKEDIKDVKKIGIVLDFEDDIDFTQYLKDAYDLSSIFDIMPEYIFSFYEKYYGAAVKKTHPEDEAQDIINKIKNEKIEKFQKSLAKALEGKPANLKILKGDPKKHIPYYLNENSFDIAVLSYNLHNEIHYIENIDISIAII